MLIVIYYLFGNFINKEFKKKFNCGINICFPDQKLFKLLPLNSCDQNPPKLENQV